MTERGEEHPSVPGWPIGLVSRLLPALALLGLVGCSNFDDFSFKEWNTEVFTDPVDPVLVIRESKDGSARRRALLCVKEPTAHGGTQQEQDSVFKLLSEIATTDMLAPCRMAAIDTLRKFRDPRVVDTLIDAYYRAGSLPAESATVVRLLALAAMGDIANPKAVDTLVRVLREPPAAGPDVDRQAKVSERIAAARSLGRFNQYQATAALVEILRTEEDVALRKRSHESLVSATGHDLPPDPKLWSDFLKDPNNKEVLAHEPTLGQRILQLTGWRSD